jgi:ABC-2 type transport system ATP-binding protein
VLAIDNLVRRFGAVVALDGLSFDVPAGQVFGFLGPNGSGKSTAMRAILQLIALDSGEVRWNGETYGFDRCRRIGYMPEERGLYPSMRVLDQVTYFARLHDMDRKSATAASQRWLERLGVAGRANDKVEALSLGNQQRVQLAAALVHEPDLLVLDEPFSGLDPVGIDELAGVLAERAAAGATVLFSSHQLDLVEDICESVAIVNHGRCVASGSVRELVRGGQPRLVVAVATDPAGAWARELPGARISTIERGQVRLVLDPGANPQAVLRAATAAGPVDHFAFESRRLSEVFREAVGTHQAGIAQAVAS